MITLTEAEMIAAFRAWQVDCRAGLNMSHEDADNMQIDDRAVADAESFMAYLDQVRNAQ